MRIMILIIRSSGLLQLISPGHGCGRRFLRQIVNLWNVAFSAVSGAATPRRPASAVEEKSEAKMAEALLGRSALGTYYGECGVVVVLPGGQ